MKASLDRSGCLLINQLKRRRGQASALNVSKDITYLEVLVDQVS